MYNRRYVACGSSTNTKEIEVNCDSSEIDDNIRDEAASSSNKKRKTYKQKFKKQWKRCIQLHRYYTKV
jgi:hypothetical protein